MLLFQGRVIALDKTAMKVEKILANVKRWDLNCVECYMFDSTKAVDSNSGNYIQPLYHTILAHLS